VTVIYCWSGQGAALLHVRRLLQLPRDLLCVLTFDPSVIRVIKNKLFLKKLQVLTCTIAYMQSFE
jgi:hypothetical protein